MNLAESIVFYLVLGLAVGVATLATSTGAGVWPRSFGCLAAVFFWPLFLPILLSASGDRAAGQSSHSQIPPDALNAKIVQVNRELDAALASLDGWAEVALAREQRQIAELRRTWQLQADRIREMEVLLSRHEAASANEPSEAVTGDDELLRSERARQQHLSRLRELHAKSRRDLLATLAWVRELAAMIHLAKFSGAPASRAEELVTQIAAAVEGLSEVSRVTAGTP